MDLLFDLILSIVYFILVASMTIIALYWAMVFIGRGFNKIFKILDALVNGILNIFVLIFNFFRPGA